MYTKEQHQQRTLDDEQRGADDAGDDIRSETLVDALVFPCQLHNRQVADVL